MAQTIISSLYTELLHYGAFRGLNSPQLYKMRSNVINRHSHYVAAIKDKVISCQFLIKRHILTLISPSFMH
jgi:hypothetical protein